MSLQKLLGGAGLLVALALLAGPGLAQDKEKEKEKKEGKEARATLIIKVPADAVVEIEGVPTKKTGTVRRFVSPPLRPGKPYQYTVVARIEPNNYTKITRTRKVRVEAGKDVEVDLTKNDPRSPDEIKIRYVPTPQEVVDAMLKMGKVGKGDVVFDLGCGDGRIVVTAVSKFGAKRGVGVDIDPERIEDSLKTRKEAGLTDKQVEFRKEDVLKLKDISDATVVCLYMGNEMNMALRPILWKSLKPGTRVVSHRFVMGDWKPEKSETITVDGTDYKVHLWTITEEVKKKAEGGEKGPAREKKEKKEGEK